MSKIYYHVVTDKPMKLGQELIFDDKNIVERLGKLKTRSDLKQYIYQIQLCPVSNDGFFDVQKSYHHKNLNQMTRFVTKQDLS